MAKRRPIFCAQAPTPLSNNLRAKQPQCSTRLTREWFHDSPAKAQTVQRNKNERPHRKPPNVEYRAFPTAATRVMITSSFSIVANRATLRCSMECFRQAPSRVLSAFFTRTLERVTLALIPQFIDVIRNSLVEISQKISL
jgi:hypothetical protein